MFGLKTLKLKSSLFGPKKCYKGWGDPNHYKELLEEIGIGVESVTVKNGYAKYKCKKRVPLFFMMDLKRIAKRYDQHLEIQFDF